MRSSLYAIFFLLLICSSVALLIHSQKQSGYTFNLLSLTWPGQYCDGTYPRDQVQYDQEHELLSNQHQCYCQQRSGPVLTRPQNEQRSSENSIYYFQPQLISFLPLTTTGAAPMAQSSKQKYPTCVKSWLQDWKKSADKFTIHGLWPSGRTSPKECKSKIIFNKKMLGQQLKQQLKQTWPEMGNITKFWAYQWKKHGTCYQHQYDQELRQNNKNNSAEIFKKYFRAADKKFRNLKLDFDKSKRYYKQQLARKLGLENTQFYFICKKKNRVSQLRVCYSKAQQIQTIQVIDCPNVNKQCVYPVIFNRNPVQKK